MPSDRLSTIFAALADPTRRAVLQRAGLITQRRQAQWRPCRLEAAPLKDVADWVERYRGFWEQRFDRLDEYLHDLQQTERPGDLER